MFDRISDLIDFAAKKSIGDFSFGSEAFNHYLSGTGDNFYLDDVEKIKNMVEETTIFDLPVLSKASTKDEDLGPNRKFNEAYKDFIEFLEDKSTTCPYRSNFDYFVWWLYKQLQPTIRKYGFASVPYATSKTIQTDYSIGGIGEPNSFYGLGTFDIYIIGTIDITHDKTWHFVGERNCYDLFDFEQDSRKGFLRNKGVKFEEGILDAITWAKNTWSKKVIQSNQQPYQNKPFVSELKCPKIINYEEWGIIID